MFELSVLAPRRWALLLSLAASGCSLWRRLPEPPLGESEAPADMTFVATVPGGDGPQRWVVTHAEICMHCPGQTARFVAETKVDGRTIHLSAASDCGTSLFAPKPKTRPQEIWQLRRGYNDDRHRASLTVDGAPEPPRRGIIDYLCGGETLEVRFWLRFPSGVVEGRAFGPVRVDLGYE